MTASADAVRGAGSPVVVMGVIGHDIHVVAARILALALAEHGFCVFDLGTGNDLDDFADAVVETGARVALVVSHDGEGEYWCRPARAAFEAAGVGDTLLYAGGRLGLGDAPPAEVERRFRAFGFDRAFDRPASFRPLLAVLDADVRAAGASRVEVTAS